ncbi:MAG: hypothetical protein RSD95_15620, partial [Clostridia bacterium]
DMFAQYGVNVPTTKSEWIAACKTFVDAGVVPFAFGGSELDPSGYTMENWIYPMLLSSESAMRANAKIMAGEISIKDVPEYKQALINAYEMFVPFIEKNDMSIPREKAYDMFIGKKRPMTIHGNFVCGVFRAANPEANIGIFPITWSENADENKLNGYFDDNLMIAADGVTDAALKWMEFASSPAGLEIWARNTGSLTSSTLAGEIEIDPIAVDILQYFNADKVYYKSDMSMFSGNFQTEWQSMCQKFFADGIDAYQNGVDSETFVTGQLEQMDLRFKALL